MLRSALAIAILLCLAPTTIGAASTKQFKHLKGEDTGYCWPTLYAASRQSEASTCFPTTRSR